MLRLKHYDYCGRATWHETHYQDAGDGTGRRVAVENCRPCMGQPEPQPRRHDDDDPAEVASWDRLFGRDR